MPNENKILKTTLTLKLTLRTDTDSSGSLVADRIHKFVQKMSAYDPCVDCNYEIVADKCGDNTVIRHNSMRSKSFKYRNLDCFFERVFELEPSCFMSVLRDNAHLESVTSNTEETVETE